MTTKQKPLDMASLFEENQPWVWEGEKTHCEVCSVVIEDGDFYFNGGHPDHEEYELCPDCTTSLSIDYLKTLEKALERSPYDIQPCKGCSQPVVCLPDGVSAWCNECEAKEQ